MSLDARAEIKSAPKDLSVQSLRGLAVLLMVAGHVIGYNTAAGMHLGAGGWRFLYEALEDIRMPLFTVLSGYVYAARPIRSTGDLPGLLRGKTRRLILPLVAVGTLLYSLHVLEGAQVPPFWRTFVFQYQALWFLQSVFLIFLLVGALDAFGALSSRRGWGCAFAASAALWVVAEVPLRWDVFTLSGAIRLLPFFLVGLAIRRFGYFNASGRALAFLGAAFTIAWSARMYLHFGGSMHGIQVDPPVWRSIVFGVGLLGVSLLYSLRRVITTRWLAWCGGFSFTVYLLHPLAWYVTPPILKVTGSGPQHLIEFTVTMVLAVGIPIAFEKAFGWSSVIRTLVLGQRWTGKRAKSPARVG